MAITIRVTPRTIERFVFVIIILAFMSTTIYYSSSSCDASTAESIEEETDAEETTENKTTKASTTKTNESSATEKTTTTKTPTGSTSYKDVEITISPLRYMIKEAGTYKKAVIDTMAFIIKNKMSKDLEGMKVEVYFWDSSSHESWRTNPKITLSFSTVKAGESSTQLLDTTEMIGIGNIDLTKTFKFIFLNETDGTIKTVSKTLKIEE